VNREIHSQPNGRESFELLRQSLRKQAKTKELQGYQGERKRHSLAVQTTNNEANNRKSLRLKQESNRSAIQEAAVVFVRFCNAVPKKIIHS